MTTTSSNPTAPRRRGQIACGTLAALLVLAVPAFATAQPAQTPAAGAQPSAADLESARELFKEGRELRQSGDLQHALERFKAAHAYGQTPVTALELGRTHIQLGELVEGREVLLSVARMKVQPDETDKSAAARAEAADLADEAKKRIPTLSMKITGVAPDAAPQVTVDGIAVPVVGLVAIRKANPGKHTVVARLGTREQTRAVDLQEGKTEELALDLASATGAGEPGGSRADDAAPPSKSISPVTWLGLGVGVIGVGVGSVFGIVALGKASNVKDACEGSHCPPSSKDDVDAGRSAATISTVGFIVGGAGIITAAIGYFVLSKPSSPQAGARMTPFVTATGLGLHGRF